MARIQRAYRTVATYRNGEVSEWHYWTPEDAANRAEALRRGRVAALNEAERARHREAGTEPERDVPVAVTVERSHEILWPHVAGDAATVDLPGSTIPEIYWRTILGELGVADADRVLSLTWHVGEYVTLELDNGKHTPTHWDVEITTSDTEPEN